MITQAAAWIASRPLEQRDVIRRLRTLVKGAMPEAHEMVYHDALGYALTASPAKRIIYIASAQDHVTFGFFFGGDLPDPGGLLEGTGKRMRHVKVDSLEQANSPALAELVRQAWGNAQESARQRHQGAEKGE